MLEEFWALVEANSGQLKDDFILYGVPMGTDAYVKHTLNKKVDKIREGASKASTLLASAPLRSAPLRSTPLLPASSA